MSMRLLKKIQGGSVEIRIHRCSETGEYRCRLYKDSQAYKPADYYTDDAQDALNTANDMLRRAAC